MNDAPTPWFTATLFSKVLTGVLLAAVAGIGGVIWLQGAIPTRDVVGTLISAVIFAYWLHLLVASRQNIDANRE